MPVPTTATAAQTLVGRLRPGSAVHLMGIGGVGMAGLAVLLKGRGLRVSGCDASAGPLLRWLSARGMTVRAGHDAAHVTRDARALIRSSAVPADHPEVAAAMARGCPVLRRGEVLAAVLEERFSVAVAGTHGKTTTTGLIVQLLRHAGRSPTFCIGGEIPILDGVAGIGRGDAIVVEADESDGTLSAYAPDLAVVTNVEPDHLENFGSMKALEDCFRRFMARAGRVVFCADDPAAVRLAGPMAGALSYGRSRSAVLRADRVRLGPLDSVFSVIERGRTLGTVRLNLPGRHNILNALAAIGVGRLMKLPFDVMVEALAKAQRPRRRFEPVADGPNGLVISDYAHHPTEIRALVAAALGMGRRRILAVFQPHRYSRTLALGPEFPPAFAGLDEVILVPVYAASESPLPGGMTEDLYALWRQGEGRRHLPPAMLAGSLEQAWDYLRRQAGPRDAVLVVGAGSVETVARWAAEAARKRARRGGGAGVDGVADDLRKAVSAETRIERGVPLRRRTTLRVGGPAELWMEAGSARDLGNAVRWAARRGMAFRVIGAGSNLLVSDAGVAGVVARLSGPGFLEMREEKGMARVGAGVPLPRLLNWLMDRGLAGLEFLEGIPGTVGGAVAMNAGAWGGEIGDHVAWVRCVDPKGVERTIARPAFSYRRGVRRGIVVEVCVRVSAADPAAIRVRRREFAERRAWWKGLRCAGSVFRNPEGDFAGRLIEAAGMKGARVGGAAVCRKHANVIVTTEGARASDVWVLMQRMRDAVRGQSGVDLQPEIVAWP